VPALLRATLTIEPHRAARPEELRARCELRNDGDEAAVVNLAPLSSPSLALELTDDHDEPVHLPPPPVPPAEVPLATIAPHERREVEFVGFLPSWIPPGHYRTRFRYVPGTGQGRWLEGTLRSEWVDFEYG
jgi:hypothetical protein